MAIFLIAQMQLNKFQKFPIIYTKGKNFSLPEMLNRPSTRKEQQLNQVNHKQLPPQLHFVTLT